MTAAFVAVMAGCSGGSAQPSGPTVGLVVTEGFGRDSLLAENAAPLAGHRTAFRLLESYADHVTTIFDGRVIESIDGRYTRQLPYETTWALNVNGIEADLYPRRYPLYPGDLVQFDLRYWYVRFDVRATVGAFPETFTRGVFGRRFPVVVDCAVPASFACLHVRRLLDRSGVEVDGTKPPGKLPPRGQPQRARVLVGPWKWSRKTRWADRIDEGPAASGVFARFDRTAGRLQTLDWVGRVASTEAAGTGLVAAMRPTEEDLTWYVTGVDNAGVDRAARALASVELRDAFAAVVTPGEIVKVPIPPRGRVPDRPPGY